MYTPRPYQNDAVTAIFAYYAKGGVGNPVVAMPTATGKSLVIAEFIKFVLQRWPRQRIICLTHVKELIKQNEEKLREQWPQVPLGIFSAGLGQREVNFPVVYGGVASVVNCVEKFGWRDLMLVDEAHLISPKENTNYQNVIKRLRVINPAMKVIGFTATPYRMGQGMITDGSIFTDVCFDLCSFKEFNKLINDGFLVAPIPKSTATAIDTSKVKITAGEFNQGDLQKAVDIDSVTYAACRETVEEGFDRKCWLTFASGIEHAEHIASIFQSMGIDAATVHSKMPAQEATNRINAFKEGKLRCIVNYGKLTTGFDHPPIDLIVMLRPTMSTGLWVQMLGRGTRPSLETHKENCLVLDFARNTIRLGPINDPVIPRKRVKGDVPGVAPIRICPQCGVYNHARSTECSACGFVFPKIEKLFNTAGTDELIRRDEPIVGHFDVQRVIYNRHQKMGKPPMIKVSYFCGLHLFSEWICFEHGGFATKKAHDWWKARTGLKVAPPSTDEALKFVSQLRVPKRIRVWSNKKYPEVLGYEY
jgi:DNA repair protein RadD